MTSPDLESRPPFPPFTTASATQKVRLAEDAWNSRDPKRVALAYTADTVWRNLAPGGTILLHDADCTSAPNAWRSALGSLALLGERLDERGLRVVGLRDHRWV